MANLNCAYATLAVHSVAQFVANRFLVPSRFMLEFVWRCLWLAKDIGSGSKVNQVISEVVGEGLPSVDPRLRGGRHLRMTI
jgi:hypothetical protein